MHIDSAVVVVVGYFRIQQINTGAERVRSDYRQSCDVFRVFCGNGVSVVIETGGTPNGINRLQSADGVTEYVRVNVRSGFQMTQNVIYRTVYGISFALHYQFAGKAGVAVVRIESYRKELFVDAQPVQIRFGGVIPSARIYDDPDVVFARDRRIINRITAISLGNALEFDVQSVFFGDEVCQPDLQKRVEVRLFGKSVVFVNESSGIAVIAGNVTAARRFHRFGIGVQINLLGIYGNG